ncbi:MAG: hypothetical protein J6X88_11490 [Bacteroidales bacterium]|nr:hypothetical protein [Bacteroidales bacterium]
MKKIWIYLLGVLTGIVVTIVVLVIIGLIVNAQNDPRTGATNGMSFFETPGDVVESSSVKVFQALGDGAALAFCKGDEPYDWYGTTAVLLYNEEGMPYYDDQIVNASAGKVFRQIGIYRYPTKNGIDKTVPIVMLMDK